MPAGEPDGGGPYQDVAQAQQRVGFRQRQLMQSEVPADHRQQVTHKPERQAKRARPQMQQMVEEGEYLRQRRELDHRAAQQQLRTARQADAE